MNPTMDIPPGFAPLFRTSPVLDLIGPLYGRGKGADLAVGLRVEAKHCNARGTIHGGILATLADVAIGYAIASSTDPRTAAITANLSLDYAGTAKIGDWVESRVDIHKRGTRLAFGSCYLCVGEERIARASAVFLIAG
jgi:uncharacterized protein (TIGR00369 family)